MRKNYINDIKNINELKNKNFEIENQNYIALKALKKNFQ